MEQEPLVIAIITNWNGMLIKFGGRSILETCISTLKEKTDYTNLKALVVDASSEDDSVSFARGNGLETIVVENRGFAYSNNLGIKYAFQKYPDLEYVLLLNNDLIFEQPHWLRKLVFAAESDQRIGIVGGRLLDPPELTSPKFGYRYATSPSSSFPPLVARRRRKKPSGPREWIIGALMLIKRSVVEKIGLFDEVYLPIGSEDIDLGDRAKKSGFILYQVSDAQVTHIGHYTLISKSNVKSEWSKSDLQRVFARNRLILYIRRNGTTWLFEGYLFQRFIEFFRCFVEFRPKFRIVPRLETKKKLLDFSLNIRMLREALERSKVSRAPAVYSILGKAGFSVEEDHISFAK